MSRLIDADIVKNMHKRFIGYLDEDMITRLNMATDAIATADKPQGEWIPVEDRLPEDGTWNLWTDGKNISIERYKSDGIDHFWPPPRMFSLDDATAWMPLPEPYKGKEQECSRQS